MRIVATRLRTLFIPCTLALIFGILLFQTDRASMKGGERQRVSNPSTRQLTATKPFTNRSAFAGSTLNAASANAVSAPNAFFAPAISASKSVNLASASPGATLNYTVTIGNAGADPALGVMFSDTIDPNTMLVPGSVNTSPLALNDAYTSIGNVGITVPAASGVLANDFDPDGTIPAITSVNTAGLQGTLSLTPATGAFTFEPAPGFEGTTTFTYTISDGALSDTGTVTITVSGMIWFIDDSVAGPGDGRLGAPFNSIANFNSLAADDPGDNIFVYSGSYTGPLTLLANQKLIGQGATASLASIAGISLPPYSNALPATGGTRPALTNTNTNVTVSTGNTIRGVDIQNTTAGSALLGTSFNNLNVSESTVSSSNATAAVNLNQGSGTAAINVSLISVAANTCTNGIVLANTTGSFTVTGDAGGSNNSSGGTIQNASGAGILLSSAQNISLDQMNIQNTGRNGINGTSVINFSFTNGTINNSGTSLTAQDSNIGFNGSGTVVSGTSYISGTLTVTGSTLTNAFYHGITVRQNTGTISDLNISNNTFTSSTSAASSNGSAIDIDPSGSASGAASVTKGTISGNSITNFPSGAGIQMLGGNTASAGAPICSIGTPGSLTNKITISNNSIAGQSLANGLGTNAIAVQVNGHSQMNIEILNNGTVANPLKFFKGNGVLFGCSGVSTCAGKINNNAMDGSANIVASPGISVGTDATFANTDTPNLSLEINGNNVTQTDGNGILATARSATGTVGYTIKNNTIGAPRSGVRPGIRVDAGNASSGDDAVCLDISGNTSAGSGGTQGIGLRKQGTVTTTNDFGVEGMGATATPGVEAFVNGQNPAGGGTLLISATSGFSSCSSAPLRAPIETEEHSLNASIGDQAKLDGGNSPSNLFAQIRQWITPVFSAFSSSISYVNLDRAFNRAEATLAPTASAAERSESLANAMSGETVSKGIAIIPPGKIVTITFSVTIDTPFPPNVCTVSNQGLVSGSNFSSVATNPATTTVLLAPTIGSCPTNITTNTDAGLCTAAVTFTTPTATGCPSPTVTCSPASGSAFAKGTTTVTCTATNGVSPNSTCSFTVTVADNQGPTFAGCPTNISANTAAGLCTAAVTYIAPTATDACEGARTVTCLPASGSSFAKGVTTVTCSASDTSGNSNSCSFTVTVADNQGPTFAGCPANISKNTDAGLCTAVATYIAPTATDACDGARTVSCSPASGTAFAKGVTTVTCTASDTSGNNGSCSFTVTVADNQGPVVACPGPISVTESPIGSGSATATFSATAMDVCDGARTVTCTPASGSSFPLGVTTVSCTASDTSGNPGSCSFTVTVGVACTINCPGNVTADAAAGQCAANVTYSAPTASAGCGTVTCSPASGSSFTVGTTTVTCSTTAGPSCSFTVTVADHQAPTVTCPANVNAVTDNTSGACSASAVTLGTATAVDNCGGTLTATGTRSDSQPLSAPYPVGMTTITWSATDASGNTGTCQQTVTVTNSDPVVSITGPASGSLFTVNTPVNFTGSFTDNTGTHTATWTFDSINVAGVVNESLKTVTASYTFTVPGIYAVSLAVTDNCGGSGSANTIGGISALVVVYDPNGGFVTGGGWINSPAGAYVPNPSLTGKANFGFNAKYKQNGSLDSETDFELKAGSFHFHSNNANWLVINGSKAQYQGTGTVDGSSHNYSFVVSVIDGQLAGGGGVDKFRITIWDINNGNTLVYDNQSSTNTSDLPTTPLGGGNIVIHKAGNNQNSPAPAKAISDFDGDGKTDLAVWDGMKTSFWQIVRSSDGGQNSIYWGRAYDPFNDVIAPGDYDGDGKTDAAVFRRSTGIWYIKQSSDDQTVAVTFGLGTDTIVPADYDGDGKTDLAVWRAKEGRWLIKRSSDKQTLSITWGSGRLSYLDVPVPGDYDGDGKADLAVYNPSTGYWLIKSSSDGAVIQKLLGDKGDMPVPADYDGDGKTDIAVWNGDSTYWHIINSSDGSTRDVSWGRSVMNDIPVPGDFDGDGLADIAVWRPATATWYIQLSQSKTVATKQHGSAGFVPIPAGVQR